ncbi:hypothetical protein QR680_011521 [Steinernema hermaphroditum]|uniref:WD repeat-containing protein 55 homolog n=1 Tax=Steinernema hermaphroditum TaxID=289476 RepID=A0AA39LZ41_9BILA|nr:hypothetical protein QR680_011521 [Steinernema hermaphroditum]
MTASSSPTSSVSAAPSSSSNLVVPVVLWGRECPRNRITCVAALPDGRTVVTGNDDGDLIQWTVDEQRRWIQPKMMMVAHQASISCISATGFLPTSTCYVSASVDGHVCLWDSVDGRSVDSAHTGYIHRRIVPHSYRISKNQSHVRLLCTGDYSEILVMDAQDLSIQFTLSSRVEPDWISAIAIVHPPERPDVVLGMSFSGMVKLWSLTDLDKRDISSPIFEDESKVLGIRNVTEISCSDLNQRIMLVIAGSSWQIVDIPDLNQLIVAECRIQAVSGMIVDIDKVAIGFADSTIVIFQLPRRKLTGKQIRERFGENPQNVGGDDNPFVFALLRGTSETPLTWISNVCFRFCGRSGVLRADKKGKISFWKVPPPKELDKMVEDYTNKNKRAAEFDPIIEQSLEKLWHRIEHSEHTMLADTEGISDARCSAMLYVANQGKMILGYEDGSIVIRYACHAVMKQLLEWDHHEYFGAQTRHLRGGHTGAVTCMLYPHEEHPRYDMQTLVSGGADFAVCVWNINTGERLYRFCSQGGPILRILVPPDNCNARILHTICTVAGDCSVALLSLKENKCLLLASRQRSPIVDVKWRPLDDFMLVKCADDSVYVWQMETANLDRIVNGIWTDEVMAACDEQIGVTDGGDEAGASQAVQMFRAFRHKNIAAIRRIAGPGEDKAVNTDKDQMVVIPSPMNIHPLNRSNNASQLLLFNIDAMIMGLLSLDQEYSTVPASPSLSPQPPGHHGHTEETEQQKINRLNNILASKGDDSSSTGKSSPSPVPTHTHTKFLPSALRWQSESNFYLDVARLCMSLLHAWNLDSSLDPVCLKKLKLYKPNQPLCYGNISRQGLISVYLPTFEPTDANPAEATYEYFSKNVRWQLNSLLTTVHLLSVISVANTLMSMRNRALKASERKIVRRKSSSRSSDSSTSERENEQLKQGWSLLAALHCVLLPDLIREHSVYVPPKIPLLARRWQDQCIEIRVASQALLIRELGRLGAEGRRKLLEYWAPFLPTLLDSALSIFGPRTAQAANNTIPPIAHAMITSNTNAQAVQAQGPPQRPPPPIPPRTGAVPLQKPEPQKPVEHSETIDGVQQVRRNQATSIIVLGVIGAEYSEELNVADLARATSQSLLELLIAPHSQLLPNNSPLRRAAIDLIGRGFVVWQPHIDISKVLLGLLDLAAQGEKLLPSIGSPSYGFPLSSAADACRTAKHALMLIATARPPALITALSKEVARYNAAAQHQTIQHTVQSPLLKSRYEVLRLIEFLAEKQYNDVADLVVPVGEILVHCLDTSLLKQKTLAEIFPPVTKFYMVGYCPQTRRIAFGGKNGSVVVHELRASKAQIIQAHKHPVTAVSFSPDGKYLATYSAQESKMSFWQTQQSFLGMGQSQFRCAKSMTAPSEFAVTSPGGTYQIFRARLVWINAKSVTLMLPDGRESRFNV